MIPTRYASILLTVAVLVAGAVALYAITAGGSAESEPSAGQPASPVEPTPTNVPAKTTSREAIERDLKARAPALWAAVLAVESGDFDRLSPYLRWADIPCTPAEHKGGIAPRCNELGVAEGTTVRMFSYELTIGSFFTEEQLPERLAAAAAGRKATLALVSEQSNGAWYLAFSYARLDGQPIRGLTFHADPASRTPLVSFTERGFASTPLDTIREQQVRDKLVEHRILYTSDDMEAWEQEKEAERNRHR